MTAADEAIGKNVLRTNETASRCPTFRTGDTAVDASFILRPHQLSFDVPRQLADDIDALVDAIERDDPFVDDYRDEVHGSARMLPPGLNVWVEKYYVFDGWRKGEGVQPSGSFGDVLPRA